MLTKNERNLVKSLRSREVRHLENKMVVEGTKGILELLESSLVTKRIYITSGSDLPELKRVAHEKNVEVIKVSSKDMEIMSSLKKAPGALAVGEIPQHSEEVLINSVRKPLNKRVPCIVLLDDLVDPGNVGTIIRTADWFGFAGVVCSPRTADVWNAKSIQASMGSIFRIPVIVADIAEFTKSNDLTCVVLDVKGENIYDNSDIPNAIVVGSESHGISDKMKQASNMVWTIPGSGSAESLNAAIAGAIVCSEVSNRWSKLMLS